MDCFTYQSIVTLLLFIVVIAGTSSASPVTNPSPTISYALQSGEEENLIFHDSSSTETIPSSSTEDHQYADTPTKVAPSNQNLLGKFRRSSSTSTSDAIIFPLVSQTNNNYNRPFSDIYNKHRPNIPTPQRSIPFNFGLGLPIPPVSQNTADYDLLTKEQNDLLSVSLSQLFRNSLLFSPQQYPNSFGGRASSSRGIVGDELNASASIRQEELQDKPSQGISHQSLFAGPSVRKPPCPNGLYKTHRGLCHEKSQRLKNANG